MKYGLIDHPVCNPVDGGCDHEAPLDVGRVEVLLFWDGVRGYETVEICECDFSVIGFFPTALLRGPRCQF